MFLISVSFICEVCCSWISHPFGSGAAGSRRQDGGRPGQVERRAPDGLEAGKSDQRRPWTHRRVGTPAQRSDAEAAGLRGEDATTTRRVAGGWPFFCSSRINSDASFPVFTGIPVFRSAENLFQISAFLSTSISLYISAFDLLQSWGFSDILEIYHLHLCKSSIPTAPQRPHNSSLNQISTVYGFPAYFLLISPLYKTCPVVPDRLLIHGVCA